MKTTATRRGTTVAEARRQRRAKASAIGGALLVSLALLVLLLVSVVPAFAAILPEDEAATSDTTEATTPAADAGVIVELTDSRTAYSREYELSDGSRKVEVYTEPVNYQDRDGSWQSFDGTLTASSLSTFAYENTKNAFKTYFTGDGDKRGTVRIEDGEFSLVFTPLGTAKAAGESGAKTNGSHNGVEYPGLFVDTTASYSVMAGMLKEQLTLASARAPKAFLYRVEASGLTPQPQEDGSIAFLDDTKTVHFVIRQPWAADSAQEPAIVNLSHSIRREGSAYMYEMTMDSEWLADKGRVFPVVVDPTVVTGSVAVDTYVYSLLPTTSFSSLASMDCGGALRPGWSKLALIKFNLPTLQNPVQIQRAYISLYMTTGSGNYAVDAYRVTSNWTSAVTYNTRPSTASSPESETNVSSINTWYDFDVANSAGQWYLSSTPNYGTMLTAVGNLGVTDTFNSSEATGDKPKLTIIYSPSYIDPRHTTYDLGEFAGHTAQATLDKGRADVGITDLEIASWGPEASLSRFYSSAVTTSSKYAPGWRFGFQRNLTFTSSTRTDYVDEAGEVHTFTYDGTLWHAPAGLVANLGHPGSNWTLTHKNGPTLQFDSTGKLTSETDRNGNAVTYGWGTNSLTMTAANGQQIQVSFNASGKITSATYATVDGTRQVTYATASPWQITYFPGQSMAHTVTYTYTSNRLTEIKALSFTSLVGDATETFHYDSMDRLDYVRFPDYASSVPSYNSSNTDARALFSYTSTGATVTTYGAVRTTSTITGQTGTAITQLFTWNPCGAMTSRTNPKSSGSYQIWTYTYSDDTNYLLSETSPLSTTRSRTYDSRGNLLTETDELNHTTIYTYPTSDTDPNRDLPLTVTDPRGAVTTYEYDGAGNTIEVTRTLNQEPTDNLADTIYVYGDVTVGSATYHGALLQEQKLVTGSSWAVTDYNTDVYYPNGANKATVKRDVVLAEGGPAVDLTEQSIYTAFGDLLERIDANGQSVESNEYEFTGRLLQRSGAWFTAAVDGASETTSIMQCYNYDAWGHAIESWTSSMNDVTGEIADWRTTTYDASGRPSVVTNKLWTETVPAGQVQSTVTYRYDGRGLEITQANSTVGGQPSLTAYDASGNVVAEWRAGFSAFGDAKARRHLLADGTPAYDAAGRLLRTTEPGDTSPEILTYTDTGSVLRDTKADGTWIEYTYDASGNETATLRSSSATTSSVYDLGGRLFSRADENDLETEYTYDCLDRGSTAGAEGQAASQFVYNAAGGLLQMTDPDGMQTGIAWDETGQPVTQSVASNVTTYTYDSDGGLVKQDDPDDKWTEYSRDYLGRCNRVVQSLPDIGRLVVRWTVTNYDSLGRLTSENDDVVGIGSQLTYPLNTAGNSVAVMTIGDSGADAVQTTLTVGSDGLETSRESSVVSNPQIPNMTRTVNTRDSGDRLTKATIATGQPTSLISQYSCDSAGRLSKQWGTTGGGSGYLSTAQNTVAYTYSPVSGLKTAENLQLASVGTAGVISSSYSYTTAGRLSSATTGGVTAEYTYGALGNVLQAGPVGNQTVFAYDTNNRLETATLGANITYFSWDTGHGRRASQGPTANESDPRIRYTYTGTGRLATYDDETRAPSVSATYTYDAQGQRLQSAVTIGDEATTTSYVYEGITLQSLSAAQSGGTNPSSWEITYLYDEAGRAYAGIYRGPSTSTSPVVFGMVVTDRGDVVELLDAAGSPFAAYRYNAWGSLQGAGNVGTGIWAQTTSLINATLASAIATRQPLRYAGYCYDAESGLYYLSARSYDPTTCQFLGKDQAQADGQASEYQYCGGDPVGSIDPSGLYAGQVSGGGNMGIYDPYAYLKSRYGGTFTLKSSKILGVMSFTMDNCSTAGNNCSATAITRTLQYLSGMYRNIPRDYKSVYATVKQVNGNKDQMGTTAIAGVEQRTLQSYWYPLARCGNFYPATIDQIKDDIGKNRPAVLNIAFGYYNNHSVTANGVSVFVRNPPHPYFVDFPMIAVYDGWVPAQRYIDDNGWGSGRTFTSLTRIKQL